MERRRDESKDRAERNPRVEPGGPQSLRAASTPRVRPCRELFRLAKGGNKGRPLPAQRPTLRPTPDPRPGLFSRRAAHPTFRRRLAKRHRAREGHGLQWRAQAPEDRGPPLAPLGGPAWLSRLG